jgi:hypothetical protein
MATKIERLKEVEQELRDVKESGISGEAQRELALALTGLEEVRMRVNRGMAHVFGRFNEVDVEALQEGGS